MLHGLDHQSLERIELVPRETLRMGKSRRELVSPTLLVPNAPTSIDKGLVLGRYTSHVGRGAKDNRIGLLQAGQDLLILPAAVS